MSKFVQYKRNVLKNNMSSIQTKVLLNEVVLHEKSKQVIFYAN